MSTALLLILLSVYCYRIHLLRRLDRSLFSHSSYYDVVYGGEQKCQEEAADILNRGGGHRRVIRGWRYMSENGPALADVLLIHETGIYIVETRDYRGWISGGIEDEYWTQTMAAGNMSSYQNFFYNPLLKNAECMRAIQTELSDMPWLPCFSLAVFKDQCELENAGLSDGTVKIIHLRQLAYTISGMQGSARRFLAPQVVDEIYDRLTGRKR